MTLDNPGLAEKIAQLAKDIPRPDELANRLGQEIRDARNKAAAAFNELSAWKALNDKNQSWWKWDYDKTWQSYPVLDSYADHWEASLLLLGDDAKLFAPSGAYSLGDAVTGFRDAFSKHVKRVERDARTLVNVGPVSLPIPIEPLLYLFPFFFALASLMSAMLRVNARVHLIWIAAFNEKIAREVAKTDEGRLLPNSFVGKELLNTDGFTDYVNLNQRNWAGWFNNRPTLFSDVFYQLASWGLALYLFGAYWVPYVHQGRHWPLAFAAFVFVAIVVTVLRWKIYQSVIADALTASGEQRPSDTSAVPTGVDETPEQKTAAGG